MSRAETYRMQAVSFTAMASEAESPQLQVQFAQMAQSYFRLAELAEKNSHTDVTYEPPLLPAGPR